MIPSVSSVWNCLLVEISLSEERGRTRLRKGRELVVTMACEYDMMSLLDSADLLVTLGYLAIKPSIKVMCLDLVCSGVSCVFVKLDLCVILFLSTVVIVCRFILH
jgi:hypothetical protein